MISKKVKLNFNPETADTEIQEIFANDLARTLWLAIRQGHVVSQYFNKNILQCAVMIEDSRKREELNAEELFQIISGCIVIGPCEQKFAEELLPFITGEKEIIFIVNNGAV